MLATKIRMAIPVSAGQASAPRNTASSIPCIDPATRRSLGEIRVDTPSDVEAAVARARVAQRVWRETSFEERRAVLRRLLAYTVDHKDDICRTIQRDTGKTREHALIGEIWTTCEKYRWTIEHGEKHLRPERMSSGLLVHKRARLEFHPLGVVASIIPWNYPFQNIVNPVPPALMAGNAIVIKPSEWVAWSSAKFISEMREVIEGSGQDPNLIQAVQGYGETGAALARAEVDTILFIGSVSNGRKVIEASAARTTPVVMELGGKDPFIVCDDADLEQAVHAALTGCFVNCGQNCVASERILVHETIYDAFERRASDLVKGLRQGDSTEELVDVGAIITPLQLEVIERAVDRAVAEGARLVAGGRRVLTERGDFFEPTILSDVTPEMAIAREEIFGPVMLLMRIGSDEAAIEIANGVSYGLSSSVFSRNHARAREIAAKLEAGMTAINEFGGITYMAQDLTFGGVKASGFGRMNGREGLRSMCNVKAVVDDRFPIHRANEMFPTSPTTYGRFSGMIDLIYGNGLRGRWRGLSKLVRPKR